ncbi:hypothetical protein [Pedobacter sp.]|jgi:hypothetical protein|uniref:hypothetical protein n=1 Tax=Pedobacter sp. TaxID=1411316 RepID=UPI002B9BBACA|nr:hypothetical protein [Pedobacter sp.]HWW41914.1 hypothetical protein [Pedobacter sp.]
MQSNTNHLLLGETVFIPDYDKSAFLEKGNPDNAIYFKDLIFKEGTPFAVLNYNSLLRNQYYGLDLELLKYNKKILLPKPLLTAPLTDEKQIDDINKLARDRNQGFQILKPAVQERLGGKEVLPKAYLEDYEFTVHLQHRDYEKGVLISTSNPKNVIPLKFANWDRDVSGYQIPFNKITGTYAHLDLDRIVEVAPNIVFLRIGDDLELDPVGVGKKLINGSGTEMLLKFPYQDKHVATRIPCPRRVKESIVKNTTQKKSKKENESQSSNSTNKRPIKFKTR